jgi:diguanylate cyclase (GGDEF)-like protein
MLTNWKFPEEMSNLIMNFRRSSEQPCETVSVLEVAQQISELLFNPEIRIERLEEVKTNAMVKFQLEDCVFDQIFDDSVVYWAEYAKLLKFDAVNETTFAGLESKARRGIAQLSIGLHAENEKVVEENLQLKSNIIVDPLTGLKNRRAYDAEVEAELERCSRSKSSFVMMVADIDKFKQVNDTYGHAIGDKILIAVAEALVDHTRRYDSVYRIGGEEFVIVLADCDVKAAFSAAERFRKSVESLEIQIDGTRLPITISIGVNCVDAVGQTVEQVFREADRLMYEAKSNGRNQCCIGDFAPIPVLRRNRTPLDLTTIINDQSIS